MDRIKLSKTRKEELSELAEYLVNEYNKDSERVQPNEIAEKLGISYSFNDYNREYLGLIDYKNQSFHIYLHVDKHTKISTPQVRYSFAHEIGHFFIYSHRMELMRNGIMSHSQVGGSSSDNIYEKEADYFASCLLLPESRYKPDIANAKFSMGLIFDLCGKYKVSVQAALIRYISLGPHPIMVVRSADGKVTERHTRHNDFPYYNLKLKEGSFVPDGTAAAEMYALDERPNHITRQVKAASWFKRAEEEKSDEVFTEMALYYKPMNQVLSVIWC